MRKENEIKNTASGEYFNFVQSKSSEQQFAGLSAELFLQLLFFFSSYRVEMKVTELIRHSDSGYYLCPRCKVTLDRDFQTYCDRCGQRLGWTGYRKAKVISPGNKSRT